MTKYIIKKLNILYLIIHIITKISSLNHNNNINNEDIIYGSMLLRMCQWI